MPNLLLCMTPGVGLNVWKDIGILSRELKPYGEYVRRGWKVKILTFDGYKIPKLPEGIEAVRFPYHHRLLWFLPWIYKELGRWADVIKTNQSVHAYLYTRAARHWEKPILLRCGYVQGEYLETTIGLTPKVRLYQWLEARAFRQATYCQGPTEELSDWVQRKYGIPKGNITVVPNFVDTELFRPIEGVQKIENSVISVGRLAPVKQFDLLIRACAEIAGCTLTIVGDGPERKNLKSLAQDLNVNLRLPGNIPNEELPTLLQEHRIFATTSKREGNPKALLEAMGCALPCVGFDSPGIKNIIKNGESGLIVAMDKTSIRRGVVTLLDNNELCTRLGVSSRLLVEENYSFSKCFNMELRIVESLT